jgi:hypothetical protein
LVAILSKTRPPFLHPSNEVVETEAAEAYAHAFEIAPMTGRKMQKKVSDITEKVIDKVDDFKGAVLRAAAA